MFNSWVGRIPWGRDRLPTPGVLGFPCGSAGKESACNVGDLGSVPEVGRSPRERKGYPLQYSCLENPMDYTVHGVSKSQTRMIIFQKKKSIYMESRRIVLMSLFTGKKWRGRLREWTCGHCGGRRGWDEWRKQR